MARVRNAWLGSCSVKASDLFAFSDSLPFRAWFDDAARPWEWVRGIKPALASMEAPASAPEPPPGLHVEGAVWIDPSVALPPYGCLEGPAWIGAGCELRPGVYIRGNVIAAPGCVLGNSSEFKNCLLLEGAQAPHFNYVGDSVLGRGAHLGAGAICSNLRLDQAEVAVRFGDGARESTGLRKLGALLGDAAEVGCNAVLNPGSVLGRRALVLPATAFSGVLETETVARGEGATRVSGRKD